MHTCITVTRVYIAASTELGMGKIPMVLDIKACNTLQVSSNLAALTLRKPYSVRATKAMGTVEMKQPAMGMNEQMKTNSDSSPIPGMASVHMPAAVSAVFTSAMRACISNCKHCPIRDWSITPTPIKIWNYVERTFGSRLITPAKQGVGVIRDAAPR